jgi:hypothetical protein
MIGGATVLPRSHSGAGHPDRRFAPSERRLRPEPGIQTNIQHLHLDSGSPRFARRPE